MRLLAAALIVLAAPLASAHLPAAPGDNASLATAITVVDPNVPVALYGELRSGASARYWTFDLPPGARVPVTVFASPRDPLFAPTLVVFGPTLPPGLTPPEIVETPPGVRALLVEGVPGRRLEFEPTGPTAYRPTATVTLDAPEGGRWWLVVYAYSAGAFGLALGEGEAANLREWIDLPTRRAGLYAWEGQSALAIYGPAVLGGLAVAGPVAVVWRKRGPPSPFTAVGVVAGGLMIASTGALVYQSAWAAARASPDVALLLLATLVTFAPAAVGSVALAVASRREVHRGARLALAGLGILGFAAWAGFGIAPWLLLVAALLPADEPPPREGP